MIQRKIFFLIIFILISASLFAQSVQPWWLSLEQGKQKFRQADYGNALMLFEDARRNRRAMYEQLERDFINFLSMAEVRRIGDSLEHIERFSVERSYTAANAALQELYYRYPKSSFINSASSALGAFSKLKSYPEAEYWIGEVYRIEGELPLALTQYRKAYSLRQGADDPRFGLSLQYKIADIHRIKQEYTEFEKELNAIITEYDSLWINSNRAQASRISEDASAIPHEQASAGFMRSGMTRILQENGVERFLEMYRYNNTSVELAHRMLGFYYVVSGRASALPHLMFAFLIQNTIIIEELTKDQFDFRFSVVGDGGQNQVNNLSQLIAAASGNALLSSYIETSEYYKTAYYLAASLYRNGNVTVALSLWSFLASQPSAGEWYSRAVTQLRSPRYETLIERP
ncbi:MAG: hypothetical protein FWB86_10645 [Treponema sp.]|nr:hypothetical protein [Treponema sp.]MCL2251912.1 hypothetical protein [Treponema sp.]